MLVLIQVRARERARKTSTRFSHTRLYTNSQAQSAAEAAKSKGTIWNKHAGKQDTSAEMKTVRTEAFALARLRIGLRDPHVVFSFPAVSGNFIPCFRPFAPLCACFLFSQNFFESCKKLATLTSIIHLKRRRKWYFHFWFIFGLPLVLGVKSWYFPYFLLGFSSL